MEKELACLLPHRLLISGTLDRRLLLAEVNPSERRWQLADLSGRDHASREWPAWAQQGMQIDEPISWNSSGVLGDEVVHRLMRPRVLLVALYHPEHFPLPRFPLAISDLARAARATLMGKVRLMDMQLGVALNDVTAEIERWTPDIIGVSATFGQHDLMVQLLDHIGSLDRPSLTIAGGSLTARNERLLLEQYPNLLIARGAGEATIQDLIAHWHGDLELAEVRGIGYHGAPRGGGLAIRPFRRTGAVGNRAQTDIFPELDLLDSTFRHRGVAQLETSRGCTNFCSFCPRGHKGSWSGSAPEQLPWILAAMRDVFDRHPEVSRTLYLVDEEFIGRDEGAVDRALSVARTVHEAGFRWETSCRIDQVVLPSEDQAWHVERASMWRELRQHGLRRCLFGVESGVTSILERFNKETTSDQNALAIRTLSALGVPTRFTYITFDPLMSQAELTATYEFQNRVDLLLRPLPELSVEEIVHGVRDDTFVRRHALGEPFYRGVSYMLVSMECLIGAAYTRAAQAAGLTREACPSMGRVDAEYADWRIGVCSQQAQLWVDRNFALDYTLKSLEKVLDGQPRHSVRQARTVLKDAAFQVFGDMLALVQVCDLATPSVASLRSDVLAMMDTRIGQLRTQMGRTVDEVAAKLSDGDGGRLRTEHGRWAENQSWHSINASDPCGT
ncbi:radical SAM protein [Actinoplanes sp. NPDC049118]|uniref:B12-binding domain-containing radical SAM protein n=1 Tax=Actinoplanes sp. NPDC049118 TaxID=3155769 RepID=UPI00340A57E7